MSLSPSFFIVGAPKAGTTALHSFLDNHPQVVMSIDKEPNYFSWQEIEAQQLYYKKQNITSLKDYLALFNDKPGALIAGEASVSYLFYEKCAGRIKDFCPEAKIIISLRDPVARALSHYQMDYSLGLVKYSLEEIWKNKSGHPQTGLYFQQYFQVSDYLEQVKKYIQVFPRHQIHFMLHENLIADRPATISNLCQFLGIDGNIQQLDIEQRNVTLAGKNKIISALYASERIRKIMSGLFSEHQKAKVRSLLFSKSKLPLLSVSMRSELLQYYSDSYTPLSEITGLSLEKWENLKQYNNVK